MSKSSRVGPRMRELLRIIHTQFDGRAPSRSSAYMILRYNNGMPSNRYGDSVMRRLEQQGLVKRHEQNNRVEVEITQAGMEAM